MKKLIVITGFLVGFSFHAHASAAPFDQEKPKATQKTEEDKEKKETVSPVSYNVLFYLLYKHSTAEKTDRTPSDTVENRSGENEIQIQEAIPRDVPAGNQ